jgi:hypothetical protein
MSISKRSYGEYPVIDIQVESPKLGYIYEGSRYFAKEPTCGRLA